MNDGLVGEALTPKRTDNNLKGKCEDAVSWSVSISHGGSTRAETGTLEAGRSETTLVMISEKVQKDVPPKGGARSVEMGMSTKNEGVRAEN